MSATAATEAQRRDSTRHACSLEATCRVFASSSALAWPATVLDISGHGASMKLLRRFEPDTVLTVMIESASRKVRVSRLVWVVHVRPHENEWVIGTQFTKKLSEAELESLLA